MSCNCGVAVREDDVILIADMCDTSRGLTYITYNADNLTHDAGIHTSPAGSRFKVYSIGLVVVVVVVVVVVAAAAAAAVVVPSFQLGTVTLAGWLVGGKSCLSSVACQCVCPRFK